MDKAEWDRMAAQEKDAQVSIFVMETTDLMPYTTDRNACALVLDEIEKRGESVGETFYQYLFGAIYPRAVRDRVYWDSRAILCADPDTICYCAVKAVAE